VLELTGHLPACPTHLVQTTANERTTVVATPILRRTGQPAPAKPSKGDGNITSIGLYTASAEDGGWQSLG
jgi:hypothetical protein